MKVGGFGNTLSGTFGGTFTDTVTSDSGCVVRLTVYSPLLPSPISSRSGDTTTPRTASSCSVMFATFTTRKRVPVVAVPSTTIVSSPSATSSCCGVSVSDTVFDPTVALSGIEIVGVDGDHVRV